MKIGMVSDSLGSLHDSKTVGFGAHTGHSAPRRLAYSMPTVSIFERKAGKIEFVPARLVSTNDGVSVEILGRGGSARLKPLIHADGLAEIAASAGSLSPGD